MRVTHVNFARGFRGGERQTLNLIEGLARHGVEQALVCRTGSELKNRVAGWNVETTEVRHPLLGHASVSQTDIVHVHEARGAYWAAIERVLRRTPYVITRRIPNRISGNRLTGQVYQCASGLFGVSLDVADRLAAQTGRPVKTILSSSTPHQSHNEQTLAIRKKLGAGPVIGHIGALYDHHKGQSVLIKAFRQLCTAYPDASLLLVGEGPDRAYFEMLADHDERIFFAGFQEDVGPWLAAMDIFAFPSREEGLGCAVLEAMALGVPVVASAVGGLPELIGTGERGLMIDSHDPTQWANVILSLLRDDTLRLASIDKARQFAGKNSIDAMTAQYLDGYAFILHKGVQEPLHI